VIRRELDLEAAAQERRGSALDTKAGLVLGFAGVIVSLTATATARGFQQAASVAAGVAAVLAVLAFRPRRGLGIAPARLRARYLLAPVETTERALLDTRVDLYEKDEALLRRKLLLMQWAVPLLALAVLIAVAGGIVNPNDGGANEHNPGDRRTPIPSTRP